MMARHTRLAPPAPPILIVLLTGCALLVGCGPDQGAPGNGNGGTVYEDQAEAVYLRNADFDINEPDCRVEPGEVGVEVVFTSCGSACSTLEDAECTASVDGDRIEVTSYGRVVPQQRARQPCPDVCAVMSIRCDLGELDEGTYTIVHGDSTRTMTLPGGKEFCF